MEACICNSVYYVVLSFIKINKDKL